MNGSDILVVDDEPALRIYIATLLRRAGYAVRMAKDGAEGLGKAREMRPALISLDLMMPGQGGIRMYKELKEDPGLREVPVLVVSAVGEKAFEHARRVLDAGMRDSLPSPQGYVPKPPDPEALLAAVARHAPLSGQGTGT